jgi:putative SOS response-associated peptidase YedK
MPVILAPSDYARWLGEEPDPRGLGRPYPAEFELMRMWPISARVNQAGELRTSSISGPVDLVTARSVR